MAWRSSCRARQAVLLSAIALAYVAHAASAAAAALHDAHTAASLARLVVTFDDDGSGAQQQRRQLLEQQLHEQGYHILSEGPGFFAVVHPSAPAGTSPSSSSSSSNSNSISSWLGAVLGHSQQQRRRLQEAAHTTAADAHIMAHVAKLGALPGVSSSEPDVRRFLHTGRRLAAASASASAAAAALEARRARMAAPWASTQRPRQRAYQSWGYDVVDPVCAAKDVRLHPDDPLSEVVPWGVREVGATDERLRKALAAAPPRARSIVCIVDSGLEQAHPEYVNTTGGGSGTSSLSLSGCSGSPACPYEWSKDVVGHGSHVAGTIAAPRNGVGVVGVMGGGAEVHVVRVWNDSGDVSQGQGPYATDLVLAYTNCLNHLKAEQARDPRARVNMVLNLSFGSAGPLTVERAWIERAAKRGDMLFVGSSGNNGSFLDVARRSGGPASLRGSGGSEVVGQYFSYPASYALDEVMSVANVRCDGSIETTSQKNRQVSIAAPGMAILSSVPHSHGAVRGSLVTEPRVAAAGASAVASGGGKHVAVGFQSNGFREPRPVQGARVGGTPSLPLVVCELKQQQRMRLFSARQQGAGCAAARDAICLVQLPGGADVNTETCQAMLKCVRGGGKGLVVWRASKSGAAASTLAQEALPAASLACGARCSCLEDLKATLGCAGPADCTAKVLPAVVISPEHAAALLAAGVGPSAQQQGAGAGGVKGRLLTFDYDYRYFDGTSMAAPHVSGAAALLWRLFPHCKAADIATGLKMSAQRLPGQPSVPDYTAGYGLLKVDRAHTWLAQNKACAQKRP